MKMLPPNIAHFFALVILFFTALSCVSDVDFDQADDIVLTQQVDLDLVYFNLNSDNFDNIPVIDEMIVIRDTTQLEFLDDSVVQENLKGIKVTIKTKNSFRQSVESRNKFLNAAGVMQYELTFEVAPSPDGSLVDTIIIEDLTEEEVDGIRNSIQLVTESALMDDGSPIIGELDFQSKILYTLEFKDL